MRGVKERKEKMMKERREFPKEITLDYARKKESADGVEEVANHSTLHFASECTKRKLIIVHPRQEYLGEGEKPNTIG